MRRRATALVAMSVAAMIVLLGLAVLLYAAYVAALVSPEGDRVGELPGFALGLIGLAMTGIGGSLGKVIDDRFATSEWSPVDDILLVGMVLGALAMLALAVAVAVALI